MAAVRLSGVPDPDELEVGDTCPCLLFLKSGCKFVTCKEQPGARQRDLRGAKDPPRGLGWQEVSKRTLRYSPGGRRWKLHPTMPNNQHVRREQDIFDFMKGKFDIDGYFKQRFG